MSVLSLGILQATATAAITATPSVALPMPGSLPMSSGALATVLLLSAVLFGIGLVGFLARRNMILMFLCTELMFQAAALAMVAFARMHMNVSGQVFVIFILTVAAAEAALALGLVVLLYRRKETLSAEAWSELRE
jgi:NADH-quinone oxidoreductase subunit K